VRERDVHPHAVVCRAHLHAGSSAVAVGLALLAPTLTSAQTAERVDLLTFAHGAIPISIEVSGAGQGTGMEHALRMVDGDPGGFTFVNRANTTTATEFVYELPAPTTFDRFAIPNVLETPSPSQTFTRAVEVYGSSDGPGAGWIRLAQGTLDTHAGRGMLTELTVEEIQPVRWVRVRLQGGIAMDRDVMFLEFSEIIGNGTQELPPISEAFEGRWRDRGVLLQLRQSGAAVQGCFDREGDLSGTVTGNILHAAGASRRTGVVTVFVLNVAEDGTLRGVASTNGAPFRVYTAGPVDAAVDMGCPEIPEPVVGCGSVLHGVTFDFDSDVIRSDSETLLAALFDGLRGVTGTITVGGHTSSEGDEAYNQALSERRARAVVRDLERRGIDPARLAAVGHGEGRPIAPNDDETGRSLNRRVEVACTSP